MHPCWGQISHEIEKDPASGYYSLRLFVLNCENELVSQQRSPKPERLRLGMEYWVSSPSQPISAWI